MGYKKKKSLSKPEEDYLLATLTAMEEENFERIFRLFGLLYDADMIHMIYDRLIEQDGDRHLKANALELLQNILDPELSWLLSPALDEHQWSRVEKTEKTGLSDVVEDFLASQDRWLVICGIFLIVELHLDQLYMKLRQAAQSQVPIIRESAEIGLRKTEAQRT